MSKINYQEYCNDISQLLKYADNDNLSAITAAVSKISKYAHALSEVDADKSEETAKPTDQADLKSTAPTDQKSPSSTTTNDQTETSKVDQSAEPVNNADMTYRFQRKLVGAQVGIYHYGESLVRKMNFQDGDMVKIKDGDAFPPELELVLRNESVAPAKIVRKTVIAESDGFGGLVAKRTYDGEPILKDDEPVTMRLNISDVERNNVQPDDIVEVAYYVDRGPEDVRVPWVYRIGDQTEALATESTPKPHRAYVDHKTKPADVFTPKIDFDLTNKTVLMAGYSAHRTEVEEVVKAHHGKLIVFDHAASGKGIESDLLTAVKHADVVIVMLHSVSHETANKAIANARSFNKMVATSNINSPLSIEEAIKRALNREPIYQQSSHVVE